MMRTVTVRLHETTADVVWTGGDGKPRCAHHPDTCLVRANSVGDPTTLYGANQYVCARCVREGAEHICSAPGWEPCRNVGHVAWLFREGVGRSAP